ncbi:MAG: hypothetical protein L6U99_08740 [Clostridium sp.]|nr:MAG: hypothetical protein L6U99_08740 [Clostridium sp.]
MFKRLKRCFSNEDLSVIETDNYYKDLSCLSLEEKKRLIMITLILLIWI